MKLKLGVDDSQCSPVLGLWIGVVARHHREWTPEELVVTSIRRESSKWPTRHVVKPGELVTAFDFRTRYLVEEQVAHTFCRMLQALYGKWLGVVLEPEWLTPAELEKRGGFLEVDPHGHIQLKSAEWPDSFL